jgi:hypothetical protein
MARVIVGVQGNSTRSLSASFLAVPGVYARHDRLIVGVEHVPRSWSKEVHRRDIACVHRDIPKDMTLSAEKRRHRLPPHLVVLAIEVWRTRTMFLVCHPWILDWLESIKTRTSSDTT